MQFDSSTINTVAMLMRDGLLCHFRKRMYHEGIGGCTLLFHVLLVVYGNTNDYTIDEDL